MAITYYKRLRMEIDLEGCVPSLAIALPGRFVWVPWEEALLADHAEVKFQSFRHEIDAYVFPCLGDRYGCQRLMREIRRKPGFLPGATWLIACPEGYVATVQGVMDHGPIGAIQNLGVVPSFRGIGLGRALVHPRWPGFKRLACAGPIWKSPPRTTPQSSSTAASAFAGPRHSTKRLTGDETQQASVHEGRVASGQKVNQVEQRTSGE